MQVCVRRLEWWISTDVKTTQQYQAQNDVKKLWFCSSTLQTFYNVIALTYLLGFDDTKLQPSNVALFENNCTVMDDSPIRRFFASRYGQRQQVEFKFCLLFLSFLPLSSCDYGSTFKWGSKVTETSLIVTVIVSGAEYVAWQLWKSWQSFHNLSKINCYNPQQSVRSDWLCAQLKIKVAQWYSSSSYRQL